MSLFHESSVPQAVLIIFHDAEKRQFLLSERPATNPVNGGMVIFPSEKGIGDPIDIAHRGVREEMSRDVQILEGNILAFTFPYRIGLLGNGVVQTYLITKWTGEITNPEPDKDKLFWVDEEEVLNTLSLNESKWIFLLVLAKLGLLKADHFAHAPKLITP